MHPDNSHVAILIDGDNTSLTSISHVLAFSQRYGKVILCCAYGDWEQVPLLSHKESLIAQNITLVQQKRIGKNATDHRLLIEAGEILGVYEVDVFIIVSSDGDFTVLCQRIRDKKKQVIGIGSRKISSKALKNACSQFFYIEDLEKTLKKP